MPRVSEAHREARREQILAAAMRCFARNGFHATSMQDVIAEAGLSVGAVYGYFTSKDQLRTAVAEQTVGKVLGEMSAVAHHEPALPLADAMARLLDVIEPLLTGPDSPARVAVQAWGEALRDPELGAFVHDKVSTIRANFVTIASRAKHAGHLPAGADPAAIGGVLTALIPGYVLQRVLTGQPDRTTYLTGLRALLP